MPAHVATSPVKRLRRPRRPQKPKISVVVNENTTPILKNKAIKITRRNKGVPGTKKFFSSRQLIGKTRLTPTGRNFLYRYINPCHSDGTHVAGVPLAVPQESAIVCSRVDQLISAPPDLVTLWDGNATASSWYLGIFVPPWIDDVAFFFASAFQPTNFADFSVLISGAQEYPSWTSTEQPHVLATTVWFCKLSSPMIQSYQQMTDPSVGGSATKAQDFSSFRIIGRGVTTYLPADALTDRGQITASQWNAKDSNINVNTSITVSGSTVLSSSAAGKAILFGEVTPARLTGADEQAYQNVAKLGCYLPIYMNEEDRPFIEAAYRPLHALADRNVDDQIDVSKLVNDIDFTVEVDTSSGSSVITVRNATGVSVFNHTVAITSSAWTSSTFNASDLGVANGNTYSVSDELGSEQGIIGTTYLYLRNNDTSDETLVLLSATQPDASTAASHSFENNDTFPLILHQTIDNSGKVARKIYVPNQNTGAIWYQGIAGSVGVHVKGRMTIEAEAQPGSSWSGFNQPGAPEDLQAMKLAAQVSHRMKHGFRASVNDNGILSKILSSLISKIPIVGEALASLI